jgi:hypothetical protein
MAFDTGCGAGTLNMLRSSTPREAWQHRGAAWIALFLLAFVAGVFLRCYQLGSQILLDDEWHAIHKLLHADAGDIATHFGLADYSIPLTLYYRFLYLHGGLSEWGLRLPMLLAGIGLLVIAPRLLRRQATLATLVVWTALMAISPFMIYHSRTARPYAITTLLVFVAIIAFRQWWAGGDGRWRWAVVYGACTTLAGWLHMITLPFTLLPFIFCGGVAALRALRGRERRAAWRNICGLALLGALTAALLAAVLLPPLLNDWGALAGKAGTDSVTLESTYRSLLLCLGSASPLVFMAMTVLFLAGAYSWWRRDAEFVAYIGTIMIGGAVALALSHPAWVQHPGTYARYLQPAVPFLLVFVAEGFILLTSTLAVVAQVALVLVGLTALYFAGPIPGYLYNPNQFMGHPYFQFDYDPLYNLYRTQLPDGPIPDFYRRLATLPPRSLTLVEAPWSLETNHDPEPLYQMLHRQTIKIGLVTPVCGLRDYGEYPETEGSLRFSQFVHLSALLHGDNGGADLLVMHLHWWPLTLPAPPQWPNLATCLPQIEQQFGAPIYRDEEIEVFALSRAGKNALP